MDLNNANLAVQKFKFQEIFQYFPLSILQLKLLISVRNIDIIWKVSVSTSVIDKVGMWFECYI